MPKSLGTDKIVYFLNKILCIIYLKAHKHKTFI